MNLKEMIQTEQQKIQEAAAKKEAYAAAAAASRDESRQRRVRDVHRFLQTEVAELNKFHIEIMDTPSPNGIVGVIRNGGQIVLWVRVHYEQEVEEVVIRCEDFTKSGGFKAGTIATLREGFTKWYLGRFN